MKSLKLMSALALNDFFFFWASLPVQVHQFCYNALLVCINSSTLA